MLPCLKYTNATVYLQVLTTNNIPPLELTPRLLSGHYSMSHAMPVLVSIYSYASLCYATTK